jgi:hypothetical protein
MMPRHNYIKVQPMVKALCKKHGIPFTEKTLLGAFHNILTCVCIAIMLSVVYADLAQVP